MGLPLRSGIPKVAPFAGAWIEIFLIVRTEYVMLVAPFAGAWIEIAPINLVGTLDLVAPFAGAWIEISKQSADP